MGDFATIPDALDALRAGKPVLVLDDEDRENEGDAIIAGEGLDERWLGWMIRHTSGYLCAPMPESWADRLGLPMMVPASQDRLRTAYTITCDAADGVTTGISAADRTRTIRLLADPASTPDTFRRPGHVVPLRSRDGGVLVRVGHTEACVDLCRLAGLAPVGALGELVHDDGSMMRTPDVLAMGAREGLPVITIAQLVEYRRGHDTEPAPAARPRVQRLSETTLPTAHGTFGVACYRDTRTEAEHLLLVGPRGVAADDGGAPFVRVHSECLTGDTFGSLRCDCGPQLQASLAHVAAHGGVVIYMHGHEGRGVGLAAKLAAYHLQDDGLDTVDAQTALGLPVDGREYGAAAAILLDLGVSRLRLLTNNPAKADALASAGIDVAGLVPVVIPPNPANERYLATKRDRMGHRIPLEA